jgi:ferredoxin
MKVRLDSAVCDGFGTCASHVPELFVLDEWGYAALQGDGSVPAAAEAQAQRAVLDCPVRAIHIVDD